MILNAFYWLIYYYFSIFEYFQEEGVDLSLLMQILSPVEDVSFKFNVIF